MRKKYLTLLSVLIFLCAVDSTAQDLVVEVHRDLEKGSMFSKVGKVEDNGFVDWGTSVKIAKASNLGVGFDGKKIAILVYGDDAEKETLYCRVGHVDSEALSVSWGESELTGIKGRSPSVTIRGNRVILSLRGASKDNMYVATGVIQSERRQVVWGKTQIFDVQGQSLDID